MSVAGLLPWYEKLGQLPSKSENILIGVSLTMNTYIIFKLFEFSLFIIVFSIIFYVVTLLSASWWARSSTVRGEGAEEPTVPVA